MAHRNLLYKTRMMRASGPTSRLLMALGLAADPCAKKPVEPVEEPDETALLRAEYQDKFGKRPFMGWSADVLREKISASS